MRERARIAKCIAVPVAWRGQHRPAPRLSLETALLPATRHRYNEMDRIRKEVSSQAG